ncbi:double-strand break repair protein mus-23 [Aspergillus luchuensis]|uniref:Double-strand break repair protein mus-23 n=1 Tax=Aspergillus kawachii TaxID=1069201 RepID=A0A146F7G4_ASPKA|nr:double-strand break repair protein mus-23 [Aspergillus luchuensis]
MAPIDNHLPGLAIIQSMPPEAPESPSLRPQIFTIRGKGRPAEIPDFVRFYHFDAKATSGE